MRKNYRKLKKRYEKVTKDKTSEDEGEAVKYIDLTLLFSIFCDRK